MASSSGSYSVSSSSSGASGSTPVPSKPHQPRSFPFPKRAFGKKTVTHRSFQPAWFSSWEWLHYKEVEDKVLCHLCLRAVAEKGLKTGSADVAFVSVNYSLTDSEI